MVTIRIGARFPRRSGPGAGCLTTYAPGAGVAVLVAACSRATMAHNVRVQVCDRSELRPPKVFQIGLTGWGTQWIRRVFREAGYCVVSGEKRRLAPDIRIARIAGANYIDPFSRIDVFTDMDAPRSPAEPGVSGQVEFKFLHQCYPDAYFMLNLGDVEHWIRDRAAVTPSHNPVVAAAFREGVTEFEVPQLWRDRWETHEAAVRAYFRDYPRFFTFDVEGDGLSELATSVSPDYDLSGFTGRQAPPPFKGRKRVVISGTTRAEKGDSRLVDEVVSFATLSAPDVPVDMPWRKVSRLYAYWDGRESVLGRDGQALPCVVDATGGRWPFLFKHPHRKQRRIEGTLNELWQHGLRSGVHLDMQDARRYGLADTGAPQSPIITYCRRRGAAGLVLWPLPGYHTPGTPDYPSSQTKDVLSFSEKSDTVAWRGNLAGRALPELGPEGAGNEHATDLTRRLHDHGDERALAALYTVPRFRLLSRWIGRPDTDLGLVLGENWEAGLPSQIAQLRRPRLSYTELYRHRFLLSLSGNDGASNFLMSMNSNSVVLREEDGWEMFYDGLFRAWEHYIPLTRGADDLDDRLEWARGNAAECRQISRRAQETVRRLVNPVNRRSYLDGIREVYEARFVQK